MMEGGKDEEGGKDGEGAAAHRYRRQRAGSVRPRSGGYESKVNSACEQVMAQTTLSMTVRSVRKAAEVRVGGMLQCGHSRAWRMLGFGCAYLSVLTAVLCCAWRRDGTGRLACLGPGEAQCRPSESSGYG